MIDTHGIHRTSICAYITYPESDSESIGTVVANFRATRLLTTEYLLVSAMIQVCNGAWSDSGSKEYESGWLFNVGSECVTRAPNSITGHRTTGDLISKDSPHLAQYVHKESGVRGHII